MKQNHQLTFSSRYRNERNWTRFRRPPKSSNWNCRWGRRCSWLFINSLPVV